MSYSICITVTNDHDAINRDQILRAIDHFIQDHQLELKDSNGDLEPTISSDGQAFIGPQIHDFYDGTFEVSGIKATHNANPTISLFQAEFASYLNKYVNNQHHLSSCVVK